MQNINELIEIIDQQIIQFGYEVHQFPEDEPDYFADGLDTLCKARKAILAESMTSGQEIIGLKRKIAELNKQIVITALSDLRVNCPELDESILSELQDIAVGNLDMSEWLEW